MITKNDTVSTIWKQSEYDESYWQDYLTFRPGYDKPFYRHILDFHEANDGLFEIAHDVGTGPGQVASELSKHFHHVVASDSNGTHLEAAQYRLDCDGGGRGIELIQCPAEALAEIIAPASADMVAAAECMPLLDQKPTLDSFHSILKPGGTLAIWFYGPPTFSEPKYAGTCQPIYDEIQDILFSQAITGKSPQFQALWKRSGECLESWHDNVDLSSCGRWTNIQRIKWNSDHHLNFCSSKAYDFGLDVRSSINEEKERIIEIKDRGLWQKNWTFESLKKFQIVLMPLFSERSFSGKDIEQKCNELIEAMGGEGAHRKFTFPVVLLLANKK